MRARDDARDLSKTSGERWGRAGAGHLLRRAGVGGSWDEIDRAIQDGPDETVSRLLEQARSKEPTESLRHLESLLSLDDVEQLQAGWIHRLVRSPRALQEKMALFWHDHFATSNAKVQSVKRMHAQNRMLTEHALGSVRDLLIGVSKDPAMIRWLDNDRNWKDHPNENYARELFELFALGRGAYTEKDIQESARAFSGWHTRGDSFHFDVRGHDDGMKVVLGQKGQLNGEDIVDICLEQPACAELLASKIAAFLWRPDPDPATIRELAETLRESGFEIAALVDRLLRSEAFHHESSYRTLIKSPVELAAGAIRALEGRPLGKSVAKATASMGQRLFEPPSVKGWDGGRAWIHTASLIARSNFAAALCGLAGSPVAAGLDPLALAEKHGRRKPDAVIDFLADLLVDGEMPEETREALRRAWAEAPGADRGARIVAYLILVSPEFQVA
ncbi:MAG: DUF1800 domain-containing protein [Planctomycetota bacterium]